MQESIIDSIIEIDKGLFDDVDFTTAKVYEKCRVNVVAACYCDSTSCTSIVVYVRTIVFDMNCADYSE